MSAIKERIIGAVTIMSNEEAEKVWNMILATYALSQAEEDAPDESEMEIIKNYTSGEPDYQPSISHAELLSKLGL